MRDEGHWDRFEHLGLSDTGTGTKPKGIKLPEPIQYHRESDVAGASGAFVDSPLLGSEELVDPPENIQELL